MKAISARSSFRPQADPNVIPFIDVLLVLLVIFMVTAPRPTVDLHFDAARAGPGPPPVVQPTLVSVRDAPSGVEISVDGEIVMRNELAEVVFYRAMLSNPTIAAADIHREARVYVSADLDVPYDDVVQVMNALHGAHFARLGVISQDADAA